MEEQSTRGWIAPKASERHKAASIAVAALKNSCAQLDSIVCDYICDVLADAPTGEEQDAGSFLYSMGGILESYGYAGKHGGSAKSAVDDLLKQVRNAPAAPSHVAESDPLSIPHGPLQERVKGLSMASLLQWKDTVMEGAGSVRLSVLLDEAAARSGD